jgi:hypothetical protein
VRARVEHSIGVIKRVFGFAKVRYRGLNKNAHRLLVTCASQSAHRAPPSIALPTGVKWPHCASTSHRQPNALQAGAQLPTLSLADEISNSIAPCANPLFRRSLNVSSCNIPKPLFRLGTVRVAKWRG